MAIISFWNSKKEQTGKSSAIAAIATQLGVNHNYKILVLSTKFNDYFYQDCYWRENKKFANKTGLHDIGDGIRGLARAILSNKVSPEIVTNYTKIVFNDNRLEVLTDTNVTIDDYEVHKNVFKDIVKMANRYYDLVFVDIDNELDDFVIDSLLEMSSLIVACVPQNIRSINHFARMRAKKEVLQGKTILPLMGRYDGASKYNAKTIAKALKEKGELPVIPYNTAFMEACNEAKLTDFFIKYSNVNKIKKDKNASFAYSVAQTTERLILNLQELQMKV